MAVPERVESPLRRSAGAPADAAGPEQAAVGQAGPAVSSVGSARGSGPLPLRGLTGWEEEYLERHQQDANTARLCNEILARCLVAPTEDPGAARTQVRELLVAERDRELVRLRRMSLGAEVSAQLDCPECGTANTADFSLDILDLDFEVPTGEFDLELPDVGRVSLRLPTAGDQEDLLDAQLDPGAPADGSIEGALDTEAARRSWILARCVLQFGDRANGLTLAAAHSLPVGQRVALEAAINARLPHLDLEMALQCQHCRSRFTAPFDVAIFFFRIKPPGKTIRPRRAHPRAGLPMVRARYSRPPVGPAAGLSAPARGGCRRRAAERPGHRRAVVRTAVSR